MFSVTKFIGASQTYSPLTILKELDRLLTTSGWTRKGANPSSLSNDITLNSQGDINGRPEVFGYEAPSSKECVWFRVSMPYYTSGNEFHSALNLVVTVKNVWEEAAPQKGIYVSSCFVDYNHMNREAMWVVGAGGEGFYVYQVNGGYRGGFSLEKCSNGNWLLNTFDTQWRFGSWDTLNFKFIKGNGGGMHNEEINSAWFNVDTNSLTYSEASINTAINLLELSLYQDSTNAIIQVGNEALFKGYWFAKSNEEPKQSNMFRKYFAPANNVQVVENSESKVFSNIINNGTMASRCLWRVS